MARTRSPLMSVIVCAAIMALSWSTLSSAFAGLSTIGKVAAAPRTSLAAGPIETAIDLPSTMLVADLSTDAQALPVIAFVCSIFVGVIGYSLFIAFGPGAEDLRDPFEEHED
mmetsp:Transcript_44467/g.81190  ORF Transcript_44467/g.81190 Transcript_44467/m.81190 type:complete len:112 (+) Transcript_44467:93-428(+)